MVSEVRNRKDNTSTEIVEINDPLSFETQSNNPSWPSFTNRDSQQAESSGQPDDHFVTRDGVEFAGTHLILDFWEAESLDNIEVIEQALRDSTEAAQATLLHIHLHHFSEGGGVSGVAVLAESHISVHTWPERGFAAFDVFMCGHAKPEATVDILVNAFRPKRHVVTEHLRGRVDDQD